MSGGPPNSYRPLTGADTRAVFDVFFEAVAEIDRRVGSADAVDPSDDAARAVEWAVRRPLFEHLAATADLAWLAERDGLVLGYARSILRDGARELTEFVAEPIDGSAAGLAALGELDRGLLGHRRDVDHGWLLGGRRGFLYHRRGEVVGHGYAGHRSGPFAALDAGDLPAMLAHGETVAAEAGAERFEVWVPMSNASAIGHVLANHFRLDPFLACLFADRPLPALERYVITSPPFFL